MNKQKALFCGLCITDIQMFVEAYPPSNTKIKAERYEILTGGPAANAAITCSFLGIESTLLSPVGSHFLSEKLKTNIADFNVQLIDPIHGTDSEPLIANIITDKSNGERTVFSYHPQIDIPMSNIDVILPTLNEYDITLFDGFYPKLSVSVLQRLKQNSITTVLDGGSWKPGFEELLPYIDIAICSADFFPPGTNNTQEVIEFLNHRNIKKIAITRGDKSIIIVESGEIMEIKVPAIKCSDTLGAGDIFHGAFCYFYPELKNFENSLMRAAETASFSCKYNGTRSWMEHYKKLNQ